MVIERRSLREQVRAELLRRMRAGEAKPGTRVNEVRLAAELQVSRSPLREALIALEGEGQIESESGKGFRFVPLSATEFEELAPVMAALEGLALELSDPAGLKQIAGELAKDAEEFNSELVTHAIVMTKDDEWHTKMLGACPNQRLLAIINNTRLAFHRYESLLMADEAKFARVAAEHKAIAACLKKGDIPGAKEALKINWINGARRVLESADSKYLQV
jgi:DNA-binding GntR family transcriptional regulator